MNSVAVTVIAVAAVRLYLFFTPYPPTADMRPHQELGRVLAAEGMRLAGDGGRIIAIGREISEFRVPAAEAQIRTFQASVKKAGKIALIFRPVQIDPLRTLAVPPGEFFEVVRQAKTNDVIVSFLGPALLRPEQLAELGTARPKVLVVCPQGMLGRLDLSAIFGQKLLVMAVVGRPDAPAVVPPGDARRAFEQTFKVINEGNLSDLPTLVAGRREER